MSDILGWLLLLLVGVFGGKIGWRFWQDKKMLKEILQREQDRKDAEANNVTTAMNRLAELKRIQQKDRERLRANSQRDLFEKKK